MLIDSLGRVQYRFFDKYGNKTFTANTADKNRRALVLERTKPSNRPKGGYRVKKKNRPQRELDKQW